MNIRWNFVMKAAAVGFCAAPFLALGCAANTDESGSVQQAERQGCSSENGDCSGDNGENGDNGDTDGDDHGGAACSETFGGNAVALRAKGLINLAVADTGELPADGGDIVKYLAHADLPGILTLTALRAETTGSGTTSHSEASAVALSGGLIQGDILKASATAECTSGGPTVSGSSDLVNLTINGTPVSVNGQPNQLVDVPGVLRVVVNEQVPSLDGNTGSITVNALHVTLLNTLEDIVVSSARADITCTCPQ
jgi:hypothetical protein